MEEPLPSLSSLGVAVLALLAERSMHPYEMYQLMLQRRDDRLVKVRPGSLYHAVDRLGGAGLVEAVGTDREGNRPERTTYAITDRGREALRRRLAEMLSRPAEEYPELPLALSQAHNLPSADMARLLEERLTTMRESLDRLDAGAESLTGRDIPERYWIDLDFQRAVLHAEITWLERLLARISSGQIDW
jgi:DNA-binding PadR family transcriptional regulator